MNRKYTKLLSILVSVAMLASLLHIGGAVYAAPQAGLGGNLLKNADFNQRDESGAPSHWSVNGTPSYVLDEPGITVEGNAGEGLHQEWISIIPGHKYKLLAQIEVLQGAMNFSTYMVNEQFGFSDDRFFDQKRPADGLTTIEKEFIAKSDSNRISVRLTAGEIDTEYRIVAVGMYDMGPAANLGPNLLENEYFDQFDAEEQLEGWEAIGGAAIQVDVMGVTLSANNEGGLAQEWIDVIPGHKYLITAQVQVHEGALSMLGYGITADWNFSEAPFFDQKRPADGLVTVKREYVASETTTRYSFRLYAGENNSTFTVMKAGMYDLGKQLDEDLNVLQNPRLTMLDDQNQLAAWGHSSGSSYAVTSAGLKVTATDQGAGISQEWVNINPGNKYALEVQVQVDEGVLNFWGYAVDVDFQYVADPFFDQLRPLNGQTTIRKEFIAPAGATRFSYRLTASESNTKFTVFKAGIYDLGSTLPDNEDSNVLLQFEDDFNNGFVLWDTTGDEGSWKTIDGKLQSTSAKSSSAKLKGNQANWDDQVITFAFKRVHAYGENHMGVRFRAADGSNFSWLLIRDSGLSWLNSGSGEQFILDFPFDLDKEYEMKLVVQGDKLDVYLKTPETTEFNKAASVTGVPERSGTIQFTSYNIQAAFDDVTISMLGRPEFALTNKVSRVGIGTSKEIGLMNDTDSSGVIWKSSNPLVAVVINGVVTGISRGHVSITASTTDGEYTDTADIYVTASPQGIRLNLTDSVIYVGESQELVASFTPSTVDNTATVWESSNPDIVSLHGATDKKRAIHGKAVGESIITVRTIDGGYIASAAIEVVNLPAGTPDAVNLKLGANVKDVPERFFGINDDLAFSIRPNEQYNTDVFMEMLSEIHFQNVRGPGGMDGNLYLYDEGVLPTNSADQDKMLELYGMNLMDSLYWMPTVTEEADKLTLDKVLEYAKLVDKPYVYNLNIIAYTPEEIVEQVRIIKGKLNAGQELFLELGNEIYDNSYRYPFPTVTEYIAKSKAVAEALREAHPEVKIGIVSIDQGFVDYIIADRGNQQQPGQTLEDYLATQGGRVAIWNDELQKDQSFFDAVIIHYYNHVEDLAGISNTKLYEYLYKENELRKLTAVNTMNRFPGKEAWITEWGLLPMFMFGESDSGDRARYQFAKTEGMAALYVDMIFGMLEIDEITMTDYYVANDPQGFGLLQAIGNDQYVKLPAFYALKEVGNLLKDYNKYYEIDLSDVVKLQKHQARTNLPVELPEVSAWGLGNDEGIKKLIVSNRTNRTVDIQLDGYDIQPLWSYGGADALPEFLINPNPSWTDLPGTIDLPDILEGEAAAHYEVEPYAIMIAYVIPTENENPGSSPGDGTTVIPTSPEEKGSSVISSSHYSVAAAAGLRQEKVDLVTIPANVWHEAVLGSNGIGAPIVVDAEHLTGPFEVVLPAQYVADALAVDSDKEIEVRFGTGSYRKALSALMPSDSAADGALTNYRLALYPSDIIPSGKDPAVSWIVRPVEILAGRVAGTAKMVLYEVEQDQMSISFFINGHTDRITAVIIDPVTGDLTYVPAALSQSGGKQQVVLKYEGGGQFAVISAQITFADIQNHWAKANIEKLASMFLVKGTSPQTFKPEGEITRAEFTALLTRTLGLRARSKGQFHDVDSDSWFAGEVGAAVKSGLIHGFADGTFRPGEPITREQAMVMLKRALQFSGVAVANERPLPPLRDMNNISAFAESAVLDLARIGIIQGSGNNLLPKNHATRAEIVTMLIRVMEYLNQ